MSQSIWKLKEIELRCCRLQVKSLTIIDFHTVGPCKKAVFAVQPPALTKIPLPLPLPWNSKWKHATGNCHPAPSHHVDRVVWQTKMASTEFLIPWCNSHRPHAVVELLKWMPTRVIESVNERTLRSRKLRPKDHPTSFVFLTSLCSRKF